MAARIDVLPGPSRPHPPITILKRARADLPLSQNKFVRKTVRGRVQNGEASFLNLCIVRPHIEP